MTTIHSNMYARITESWFSIGILTFELARKVGNKLESPCLSSSSFFFALYG